MFIAHVTPILAEAVPSDAFMGNLVLAGCLLLATLFNGLMCYFMGRRTPPLAEQLHRDFMPRTEVDKGFQRLHARIDEINSDHNSAAIARGKLITKMEALEDKQDEINKWLHLVLKERQ
jgi:hypothetical protein